MARGKPENRKYKSELERRFLSHWKKTGIPIQTQVMFHPTRKWRFDFAFSTRKLAIEIQGYGKGHADYMSMANDYTKHNEAVRLGWSLLYFMGHDIKDEAINKTIDYIINTLNHTPTTTPRETAADLFRKLHAKHTKEE